MPQVEHSAQSLHSQGQVHPQPGHTSALLEIDILVIRIFFNKAVIIINQIFESNYKEYKAKSQSITDFKVFLNDKKWKW